MARPVRPSASRESHAPGLFPAVAAPGGRPVHALPPAPAVRLALVPAFASLRFRMRWCQPSRTQCRGPRRCHSRCPSRFHSPLLTCGPFPPPALPGLSGSTDLSATLTGPACPLRDSGLARARHRQGFPCCCFPSSSMRASANTPAETTGACVARFPVAGGLPRYNGGSASASCFSRPARRLLAFSPAWSLNRLTRPFDARVLQSISLPPRTALAATNRSDSCCAGFAPARRKRLSTAHDGTLPS